jgi:hypothetical protein
VPVDLTSIDADEYRAGLNCGPQGDDGEDLGTADLFGAFGVVDGDDGVGMATPSSTASTATPGAMATVMSTPTATVTPTPPPGQRTRPTSTTQAHGHRTHTRTSDAWNNFEELFHIVNGKRIRYGAKCNYCKKVLTAQSTDGTGHLLRHQISCARKADHAAKAQSVLNYGFDGSVRRWD